MNLNFTQTYKAAKSVVLCTCIFFVGGNLVAYLEVPALKASVANWYSHQFPHAPLLYSLIDTPTWVVAAWYSPSAAQFMEAELKARQTLRHFETDLGEQRDGARRPGQ